MVIFEWFQSFISHSCCGSVVTPRYVVFCAKKARGSGSTHFWWIKAKRRNMETDRKRARERDKVKKRERWRHCSSPLYCIGNMNRATPIDNNRPTQQRRRIYWQRALKQWQQNERTKEEMTGKQERWKHQRRTDYTDFSKIEWKRNTPNSRRSVVCFVVV